MTGKELIKWIQDNEAEDLPVCFDLSAYETELYETDKAEIETCGDFVWGDDALSNKKIIHIY